MSKGLNPIYKINSFYGLRVIYEDLDGECLDENCDSLVICSMPDDSGCWCENSDGVEIFRTVAQGVYLKGNRYKHFLDVKNGSYLKHSDNFYNK